MSPSPLPTPPSTRDPIAFGKAAAAALWSYDTRVHSQPKLLAALRTWLTGETRYASAASIDAVVPSPVLWGRMADNGQDQGEHQHGGGGAILAPAERAAGQRRRTCLVRGLTSLPVLT
ncbi:hypothetical protein ACIBCM_26955 [Streptomyces sp. NPDC051018]|uniref:hypothetical protein n=1 Tax=Streptomyces sp. NPDC051018 TaxID=3365639 RepID=UPI0037A8EB86